MTNAVGDRLRDPASFDSSQARPAGLRVLVVDSERLNADILTIFLQACGYLAKCAYTGIQALEIAGTFKPHALLSDVDLPGTGGFELANQIRAAHPGCRLLFLAKNPTTALRLQAAQSASPAPRLLSNPPSLRAVLAFLATCTEASCC